MRLRPLVTALALVVLGSLGMASPPALAQAPPPKTSTVTVVHGLRGQLVDVYLDGQRVLEAFQPERVTDPIPIAPGDHQVALRPAQSPANEAPMAGGTVTVKPDTNISVVAHLDPNNRPTVSTFDNDTSSLPAGQARLVARNTAAVAPVTLVVNGAPKASMLASNDQFGTQLASGTYQVSVEAPAGALLVPPNDVPVPEGVSTIMYLIGSQRDNSLIWIGQAIGDLQSTPAAVPTGNSGLVAPRASGPTPIEIAGVGAALLVVIGGVGYTRRRRAWS